VPSEPRLEPTAVALAGAGSADFVVAELLADAVGAAGPGATVLDCGGGSGRFAVPLAGLGAVVTVVDVSVDALATLRRRALEAGVADRIVPVQGESEAVGAAAFDIVLAHGILEVVTPVPATFGQLVAAVRPGGVLSVLVRNPAAVVLARALAGDLAGAERELAGLDADPNRPGPDAVRRLCAEHELTVEQVHGIGVFRDLVPGAALDAPGAREALARLEVACGQLSPFSDIAARVHLLARRSAP
jgi:S-adenosylmethionine-dependent methyltransferase